MIQLLLGLMSLSVVVSDEPQTDAYFKERDALVKQFERTAIGGNLTLTKEEEAVNNILVSWKNEEYEIAVNDSKLFLAGQDFYRVKPAIEKSNIFKLIQKLPKGASLYAHAQSLVSDEFILKNITYRDNLFATVDNNGAISLRFSKNPPDSSWKPIAEYRENDNNFDTKLKEQLSFVREKPEVFYALTDYNDIWELLLTKVELAWSLIGYKPVFEDHFYQGLKELYEDNIRYLDLRTWLRPLYDLDGNVYSGEQIIQIYQEVYERFLHDYPDFWGVKLIPALSRSINNTAGEQYVDFMKNVTKKFPNFIGGLDLIGREDNGVPLKDLIPTLLKIKEITNFFFYAGETLSNGDIADQNLIDAVLLGTVRIGQPYAVWKHPEVMELVKERNIALEICPIANQCQKEKTAIECKMENKTERNYSRKKD